MSIRPYQRICLYLAILVALDSFPVMAQSGAMPAGRRARVYEYSATETAREQYVAVLGEVMNPGTYHVDPSEMNLQSVIVKRAGGFTRDASRNIRVIRDGKVNHQERYSEASSSRLNSGDVLIVDSESHGSRTTREFGSSPTAVPAVYQHPVTNDGIQLALINVLDYPVVVTIPPNRAVLSDIVDRLGQSQDVCFASTVLTTQGITRGGQGIQLVSGSAVVFNRGAVNKNKLPANLPKPIESQIAIGAYSNLSGRSQEQTDELHSLGQQPIVTSNAYDSSASPALPPTHTEVLAPLPPELPPALAEPTDLSVNQKPKIATLPYTGSAQITNSSLGNPMTSMVPEANIPQLERPRVSIAESTAEAPLPPLDDMEEVQESSSSFTWAIATLFLGGLVIAGAVIFRQNLIPKRRHGRRVSVPPVVPLARTLDPVEPIQRSAPLVKKTLLELLIKNEMPTTIESIPFPSDLTLQGRIVPKPILRLDAPQNVVSENGPHLVSIHDDGAGYPLQDIVAELDKPDTEPIKRPHFIERSRPATQSVAEAAPSKPVPAERSSAPLAKALFDLEQGGRS